VKPFQRFVVISHHAKPFAVQATDFNLAGDIVLFGSHAVPAHGFAVIASDFTLAFLIQTAQTALCAGIALLGGEAIPAHGFTDIRLGAKTVAVQPAKLALCANFTLQREATNRSNPPKASRAPIVTKEGELPPPIIINYRITSGERLLNAANALNHHLAKLPTEQAQIMMLGAQAVMGPGKAIASLGAGLVLNRLYGDEIQQAKERAAVKVASSITQPSAERLQESNDKGKVAYQLGQTDTNGDARVQGAVFLFNVAAGSAASKSFFARGKRGNTADKPAVNEPHFDKNATIEAEKAALNRIKDKPKGPNLEVRARTKAEAAAKAKIESEKAINELNKGNFPGTPNAKGYIRARQMPASPNPNVAARDYIRHLFGGEMPTNRVPIKNCASCWKAKTSDGTTVIYRPAGSASFRTPNDMTTVEVNNPNIVSVTGNNKPLKIKFPKQ